jgi:hypothetical protein
VVAIVGAALAIACSRPAGEGSAADRQEQKPALDPVKPVEVTREPRTEQQAEPRTEQQAEPRMEQPSSAAAEPVTGALSIAEITTHPDAHMRETVVVVGEIGDMIASRAFELNAGAAGRDDDIMVLSKGSASWKLEGAEDSKLRVEGKLQRIPAANLTKLLGWKPDDRVQNHIDGESFVLIADRVERLGAGEQDEREGVRGEDPR